MSKKFSKSELKSPDQLTLELKKGFSWSIAHAQWVLWGSLGFISLGVIISSILYFLDKKELKLQEKYYLIEKVYLDKKASHFTPTLDLEKDYGDSVSEFKKFLAEASGSQVAKMAAMTLASLQNEYKKTQDAISTLDSISLGNDLLSSWLRVQLGTYLADQNNCPRAVEIWKKLMTNKQLEFLWDDLRLKQALCYEAMNDPVKAEALYSEIADNAKKKEIGRAASQYLRLLKQSQQGSVEAR